MTIKNATQFTAFITSHGLIDLDPTFRQLSICMGDFSRHCNCHRREDKDRIYQKCNKLYHVSATIATSKFRNEFLSRTSDIQIVFYSDNNQIISVATR